MKTIKLILALSIAIFITSCSSDDNKTVAFDYIIGNVAGNYTIKSYNADLSNTVNTQGTNVAVSSAKKLGDTFQVNIQLNANGTYTALGQYRVVTTVTPVSGSATTTPAIINVDDSGSFSVSTSGARTISFVTKTGEFLLGKYDVNLFNETTFTLTQDSEKTDGNITTKTKANFILEKK
ncbi:MAG: hypothetical protein AB8B78_05160 [Polaribacter sp.]